MQFEHVDTAFRGNNRDLFAQRVSCHRRLVTDAPTASPTSMPTQVPSQGPTLPPTIAPAFTLLTSGTCAAENGFEIITAADCQVAVETASLTVLDFITPTSGQDQGSGQPAHCVFGGSVLYGGILLFFTEGPRVNPCVGSSGIYCLCRATAATPT